MLLGPINSRLFTCSNVEKRVLALVLSLWGLLMHTPVLLKNIKSGWEFLEFKYSSLVFSVVQGSIS